MMQPQHSHHNNNHGHHHHHVYLPSSSAGASNAALRGQMPVFVTDMHPLLFQSQQQPNSTVVVNPASNAHNHAQQHFQTHHHLPHHAMIPQVAPQVTTSSSLAGASAAAAAVVAAAAQTAQLQPQIPGLVHNPALLPNNNNNHHYHHHHHNNHHNNPNNNHSLPTGMHPHHWRTRLLQQQNMEAQRQMYEQHLHRLVFILRCPFTKHLLPQKPRTNY